MANYGYIHVVLTREQALAVLTEAAGALFGDRLRVRIHETQSTLLLVEIPSVNPKTHAEAKRLWLAHGEPAGFSVEHNPTWYDEGPCLAFRGGPRPPWLRWVQGCVEEQVSDALQNPVVYDATGEAKGPGARWYRNAPTYREHCEAHVGRLDAGYERWFQFAITPPQFLDGAPPPSKGG